MAATCNCILIADFTSEAKADHHTYAVSCQSDKTLRCAFDFFASFVISVNLPGNKEEVIADSVQHNAQYKHPHFIASVTVSEQCVAQYPRRHPHQQRNFNTEAANENWQQQHK